MRKERKTTEEDSNYARNHDLMTKLYSACNEQLVGQILHGDIDYARTEQQSHIKITMKMK